MDKYNIRLQKARDYYYEHKDRYKEQYLENRDRHLAYMRNYNKTYYRIKRDRLLKQEIEREPQQNKQPNYKVDFTLWFDE